MDIEQYVCWDTNILGAIKIVQEFFKSTKKKKYTIISVQYIPLNNKVYGIVVYKKGM